jgi:hypothetical protein
MVPLGRETPQLVYPPMCGPGVIYITCSWRLEQNPSNSAHFEIVQGGFFLRKKPLEGRAFWYIYSDSALAR